MIDYDAEFKAAGMNPIVCARSRNYRRYFLNGFDACDHCGGTGYRGRRNYRKYFLNGFGVSLSQSEWTLGGNEGLWELAVLHRRPHARRFTLCYTTAITSGLIGNLSVAEALALVARVQALDITGKEMTV